MKPKPQYYAIRASGQIRVAEDKWESAVHAARQCFGGATVDMEYCPLGTNKSIIQSNKKFHEIISNQDNWRKFIRKVQK